MPLAWEDLHKRLNRALPGDANKAARREWLKAALGYVDMPANLWSAYGRADGEQLGHVERRLEQLEAETTR